MRNKPLKDLNTFCSNKKKQKNLLHSASISFTFTRNDSSPERIFLKSYLNKNLKKFREEPSRNILKGAIISKPRFKKNKLMLGITYRDKRDNNDNEDLFEISSYSIRHLKPKEVAEEYPEYKGYHWSNKQCF